MATGGGEGTQRPTARGDFYENGRLLLRAEHAREQAARPRGRRGRLHGLEVRLLLLLLFPLPFFPVYGVIRLIRLLVAAARVDDGVLDAVLGNALELEEVDALLEARLRDLWMLEKLRGTYDSS